MGQPKHIRVVDDNGDVRDVVIPVLEIFASAAHRFLKTGDPVDCAILDVRITQASLPDQGPGARRSGTDQR
jgi:hypothetical protein